MFNLKRFFWHPANNIDASRSSRASNRKTHSKAATRLPILSHRNKQQSLVPSQTSAINAPILRDPARTDGGYNASSQRPQPAVAVSASNNVQMTPAQASLAKMTEILLNGNLGKPGFSLSNSNNDGTENVAGVDANKLIGIPLSTDARIRKLPTDSIAFTTMHLLHKLGQESDIFSLQKTAPDLPHEAGSGQMLANIQQNIDAFGQLAKPGRSDELNAWMNDIYATMFDLMVGDQKIHSSKPANVLGKINPDVAAAVRNEVDKVEKGVAAVSKGISSAVNKAVPGLVPERRKQSDTGLSDQTNHASALPLARLQWALSNAIECMDCDVGAKKTLEAWRDQLHGEYIHQAADEVVDYLFSTTYRKFQKFAGLEAQSITAKLGGEISLFNLLTLNAQLSGTLRKQNQGDEERITVPFLFGGLEFSLGYKIGKDLKIGDLKLGVSHNGTAVPAAVQHSFKQFSTPTLGGSTGLAMWRMLKEEASRNLTLAAGQDLSTSQMDSRHLVNAVMDKVGINPPAEQGESLAAQTPKELAIKTMDYRNNPAARPPNYNEIKQMDKILARAQNGADVVTKSLCNNGVPILDAKGKKVIDPKDFDRAAYPQYARLKDPFSIMPVWIRNYGAGVGLGASIPGVVSIDGSTKDTEAKVAANVFAPQSPTELMIAGPNDGPDQQRQFFKERRAMLHNWSDAHPRLLNNIKVAAGVSAKDTSIGDFSQKQCEKVLKYIEHDLANLVASKKALTGQDQVDGPKTLSKAEKRQHRAVIRDIDDRWLPTTGNLKKTLKPRQVDRDRKQAIAFTLAAISDRMRELNQKACDKEIFSNVDNNLTFKLAQGQNWSKGRSDHATWCLIQDRSLNDKGPDDGAEFNRQLKEFYKSGEASGFNGLVKRDGPHRLAIREFNDTALKQLERLMDDKQQLKVAGDTQKQYQLAFIENKIQQIIEDDSNSTFKPVNFAISKEVEAQITPHAEAFWGKVTTEDSAEGLTTVDHDTRGAIVSRLKKADMTNDHMPWRMRDHEIGTTYDMKGDSRFQGELKFVVNDPVISNNLSVSVPLGSDNRKLDLNIGVDIQNRHFKKQVNEWMWGKYRFIDLNLNYGIFALFDKFGNVAPDAGNQLKQALQGHLPGNGEMDADQFEESFSETVKVLGEMRRDALTSAGLNPDLEGEQLLAALGAKSAKRAATDAATWSLGMKFDRGLPLQIRWTLSKPQYRFDPHNNLSKDVAFENPRGEDNKSHFAFESVRVVTRNPLAEGSRRGMFGSVSFSPTRAVKRALFGNYAGPKFEFIVTNSHRETVVEHLTGRTWNPVHRDYFRHWGNRGDLAFRGSSIMMETPMEQALREKRPVLEKLISNMANPCSDARAENAFIQASARVAYKEVIADRENKIANGEGVLSLHRKAIKDAQAKLAASEGREKRLQEAFHTISKKVSTMIGEDLKNPEHLAQHKKLQHYAKDLAALRATYNEDATKLESLTNIAKQAEENAKRPHATNEDKAQFAAAKKDLIAHKTAMNKSKDSHKELQLIKDYLKEFNPEKANSLFDDAFKDMEGFLNDSCEYAVHKIVKYIRPLPYRGKDRSKESRVLSSLDQIAQRVPRFKNVLNRDSKNLNNDNSKPEMSFYQGLEKIADDLQKKLEQNIAQQEENLGDETNVAEKLALKQISRGDAQRALNIIITDRKKLVETTTQTNNDLTIIENLKQAGGKVESIIEAIQSGEGAAYLDELGDTLTLMAQASQRLSAEYRPILSDILELESAIPTSDSAFNTVLDDIKQQFGRELDTMVENELILRQSSNVREKEDAKLTVDNATENMGFLEEKQINMMQGRSLYNAIKNIAVELSEKHSAGEDAWDLERDLVAKVDAYNTWRDKLSDDIKDLLPSVSQTQALDNQQINSTDSTFDNKGAAQLMLSPEFSQQLEHALSALKKKTKATREAARGFERDKSSNTEITLRPLQKTRKTFLGTKSNDAIHKWEEVEELGKKEKAAQQAIKSHRKILNLINAQKKSLGERFGQTNTYSRSERKQLILLQEEIRSFNRYIAEFSADVNLTQLPALRLNDIMQKQK